MKKILCTCFAVVVAGTFLFGGQSKLSKTTVSEVSNEPIIYTAADEDLQDNGTISDGINNTSLFLNDTLKGVSDFSDYRGIEVIKDYSNAAVRLAKKRNAGKSIIEKLIHAEQLIQEAAANEDISKLQEANKILMKLDLEFNKNVLSKEEIESIKSKLNE
jgi:hypothetical protein